MAGSCESVEEAFEGVALMELVGRAVSVGGELAEVEVRPHRREWSGRVGWSQDGFECCSDHWRCVGEVFGHGEEFARVVAGLAEPSLRCFVGLVGPVEMAEPVGVDDRPSRVVDAGGERGQLSGRASLVVLGMRSRSGRRWQSRACMKLQPSVGYLATYSYGREAWASCGGSSERRRCRGESIPTFIPTSLRNRGFERFAAGNMIGCFAWSAVARGNIGDSGIRPIQTFDIFEGSRSRT